MYYLVTPRPFVKGENLKLSTKCEKKKILKESFSTFKWSSFKEQFGIHLYTHCLWHLVQQCCQGLLTPIMEQGSITAREIFWMAKAVIPWWSGMPPVTVHSSLAPILANMQPMPTAAWSTLGAAPLGQSKGKTSEEHNGQEEIKIIMQPLSPAACCLLQLESLHTDCLVVSS